MKTILHIGMPKTGTTALQDCLRASRDALADRGVLYPQNPPGCRFNNHRMLVFGFLPFDALPRHILSHPGYTRENYLAKYAEFLDGLYAQAEASRPGTMILSSETLFRTLDRHRAARLREGLAPLGGDVSVVAYLRRPSEQYLSNLQQRLRQSADLRLLKPPILFRHLQSYARAFGRDALHARVYSRDMLRNGDIVDDFLATCLPAAAIDTTRLTRKAGVNSSVSAEAMDLLRRYRLAFHPGADDVATRDSTRLVQALRRAGQAIGAPKPRLRPEVADFLDYSFSDPLRLRDAFGIVFPRLDYARLERRRFPWLPRLPRRPRQLSEIVLIDRELRRAMLAELRTSQWAAAAPGRIPWIDALLREPPEA